LTVARGQSDYTGNNAVLGNYCLPLLPVTTSANTITLWNVDDGNVFVCGFL